MPLGVPHAAAGHAQGSRAGGEDAGGLVGAGQLGVPGSPQPGGLVLGAGGEGDGAAGGPLFSLLGDDPGGVTVGLEWAQDLLAVEPSGGLLLNTPQPLLQVLQLAVGGPSPRAPRPPLPRSRHLVRMFAAPLGLVPISVGGDLLRASRERAHETARAVRSPRRG